MKKFLVVMLILLIAFPVYSWDKDSPDIETLYVDECFTALVDNQGDLDRLVTGYRRGAEVSILSTTQYSTAAGELVLNNSAGTVKVFVRNTSAITTTPTVGASTTYYVYAIATSVDATTFTIETSTNATTPTGTYFRRLATFTTNSSSLIVSLLNDDFVGFGIYQTTDASQVGGTGATLAKNTVYKALTNGFVLALRTDRNDRNMLRIRSDGTNPPSRILGLVYNSQGGEADDNFEATLCAPIRQGNYWKVENAGTVYWISIS